MYLKLAKLIAWTLLVYIIPYSIPVAKATVMDESHRKIHCSSVLSACGGKEGKIGRCGRVLAAVTAKKPQGCYSVTHKG